MTKVYVMESCPDCIKVKEMYSNDPEYQLVDIGKQARDLKEFLALRDNHPAFDKVRERGTIGIPCFVKEDGDVVISLKRYEEAMAEDGSNVPGDKGNDIAGDKGENIAGGEGNNMPTGDREMGYAAGAACNLDGTGC